MEYVGLHAQQRRNNLRSTLLLCCFPLIILALVWAFFLIINGMGQDPSSTIDPAYIATAQTIEVLPWVVGIVGIWFLIAYFANTAMVRAATGARPLERRENPRVYNIVENLCIAGGMPMPKVNVIDTPELNAFASGIDEKSYTVTVTTGICSRLDDAELTGVIAHELTHIRNRDTRLLIISIVFVGIMSALMSIALRIVWNMMIFGSGSRDRDREGGNGVAAIVIFIVGAILAAVGYFFALLTRFAISRKREYMADAGGAELCGNPLALASALRKISSDPMPAPDGREDVAQLFIVHPALNGGGFGNFLNEMFSTHPSIESRIKYLEQF